MPREIDVRTVLEISNYLENAEKETPQEAYDFLKEYYPDIDVGEIVDIIRQKRGAEYLAQIEIIKRAKKSEDNNFLVKSPSKPNKLEKDVLIADVSEQLKQEQKKKSNKLKYLGLIGIFLLGGAILTNHHIKNKNIKKPNISFEQNSISNTDKNPNTYSKKRAISYLGPNNSNTCTLNVKTSQLYESANLEVIINSDDLHTVEIKDKLYQLSPGKNKIYLNGLFEGKILIKSAENSNITFTPTKLLCQNRNEIKIIDNKETIIPDEEISVEKLTVNFKGRTMLLGNFGKELEDSLNPLFRTFTFKNKEGRIYSFNVSNTEFNSFCKPEKLTFDKIYIERDGKVIGCGSKMTGNFVLDMAAYENRDFEENLNIFLSDKRAHVTIKSEHPWRNPEIHLISAREKEYRITSKEIFDEKIIFLDSEGKAKIKPGFYMANVEIPERDEWMGRKACRANKRIMVIPGIENSFLFQEHLFRGSMFYLKEISDLKKLRDNSELKEVFKEGKWTTFSKDTLMYKKLNIDGDNVEITADIPYYSIYKKWEQEGMKASPRDLINPLEGKLKLDLTFSVNGNSVSKKVFCDGRGFLEDLDLNHHSLKSDSLINLNNEKYVLEFKYIPVVKIGFKHQIGFLTNKAEGTLNSYSFKYNLRLLKQKDMNLLVNIEDNGYSIKEQD